MVVTPFPEGLTAIIHHTSYYTMRESANGYESTIIG